VAAGDSVARERLASYLVHAPFSLARLHYGRDASVVTYEARAPSRSLLSSPDPQRFSPLDALAALTAFFCNQAWARQKTEFRNPVQQ
jgi:hypothetical protein